MKGEGNGTEISNGFGDENSKRGNHLVGGVQLLPQGASATPTSPKLRPVPKPRKPKPRKLEPSARNGTMSWDLDDRRDVPKSAPYYMHQSNGSSKESSEKVSRSGSAPDTSEVIRTSHVTDIRSLWENKQTNSPRGHNPSPQHRGSSPSPQHKGVSSSSNVAGGKGKEVPNRPGHVTNHVTNHYVPGKERNSRNSGAFDESSMLQNLINLRIRANSVDGEETEETGLDSRKWSVGSNCSSGTPSPSHAAPMVSKQCMCVQATVVCIVRWRFNVIQVNNRSIMVF